MGLIKRAEWSKSYKTVPRDNILSHVLARQKQFVASFANDSCPPTMNLLIGWEYGRIWLKERDEYVKKKKLARQTKKIKNDYKGWLAKRKKKTPSCCQK